jgi:hypothetical protein
MNETYGNLIFVQHRFHKNLLVDSEDSMHKLNSLRKALLKIN